MIAFPVMLVPAAEEAGIVVPKPEDLETYTPDDFPHFHLFLCAQLGAPMPYMGVHWENAKVIARIPLADIQSVTYEELQVQGFQIGFSK